VIAERNVVARPGDANYGNVRARNPEAIDEMRRLRRAGTSCATIAEQFGVSVRTVYRYVESRIRYHDVVIDGWVATFARRPREAPWRVSDWKRVR
jgi:DNA invertase Pin-like site-specific DNA recombinase